MHKILYSGGATAVEVIGNGFNPATETGADSLTFFSIRPGDFARTVKDSGARLWLMCQWDDQGEKALPKIEEWLRQCRAAFGDDHIAGVSLCDEWDWQRRAATAKRDGVLPQTLGRTAVQFGFGHRAFAAVSGNAWPRAANPALFAPELAKKRNDVAKSVFPDKATWINVVGDKTEWLPGTDYIISGADFFTVDYYTRIAARDCTWKSDADYATTGWSAAVRFFHDGFKRLAQPHQKFGYGAQFFDQTICDMPATTLAAERAVFEAARAEFGDSLGLVYGYVWSDGGSDRHDMLRKPSLRGLCKQFMASMDAPTPPPPPDDPDDPPRPPASSLITLDARITFRREDLLAALRGSV